MLSKDAAIRALLHLTTMGDTDIFPAPFEFKFYADEAADIADKISSLDTAQYVPRSCIEVLSPKGALSFRIAHQLYPADTLLYTTAVIEIAPSIEALRLPLDGGPFSYRYIDDPAEPRLFSKSSSFHDWLQHLKIIFERGGPFDEERYVIESDISDFYSRIYFHRIEHVLDDCNATNSVRKIIEGVIKFSRARQSYGLPVGTSASRLLAEALLNDTDVMLLARSLAYSRYVDDFRIVIESPRKMHTTLCALASHLMLTEGLSLNASKTRTSTAAVASTQIDQKLADVFNDDELVALNRYIKQVYDDEDVSVEDIEEVEPENLATKLKEVIQRQPIDYAVVKVILKAFRATGYDDPTIFLSQFPELLYYLPRDFCFLLGALSQRHPEFADQIADQVIGILGEPPFSEMTLSKIWVAHLFTSQALPITNDRLELLNLSDSAVEKRQFLLLKGLLRDRSYFRGKKTSFNEASDWEKPALLFGASCLSTGEYSTWLDTIKQHYQDPFAGPYLKWLRTNQSQLYQRLREDFKVENRSERLVAAFAEIFADNPL